MGIAQKHAYRFGFLKSEKWQNARLEALAHKDAKCMLCGTRSLSNDAHHVWYPPSVWDTSPKDLVILCRKCHDLVHAVVPTSKNRSKAFIEFRIAAKTMLGFDPFKKKLPVKQELERKPVTALPTKKWKESKCAGCRSVDIDLRTFHIAQNRNIKEAPHHYWRLCDDCIRSLQEAMKGWSDDPYSLFPDLRRWKKTRER